MQPVFQQALRPNRHIVLGTVMQPLTLGHVWLLHRETEILEDKTDMIFESLLTSCLICSMSRQAYERVRGKWWLGWVLRLWGWRCRKLDMPKEYGLFCDYLNENCAQPEWKVKDNRMRTLAGPWHIRIVAMLMSELGMTKADALDTPALEASALLTCAAESAGDIELWGDNSEELWQRALAN